MELSKELLRHNTYSCGTACPNRKQYPAVLKDVSLERGQHKSQVLDGVECFVWKDKKNIHFIQNICQPDEMDQVMRRNKDGSRSAVPCPLSVKLYNQKMGGVDLADSKRKVYSCSRKSKKWWHPLLYFFLNVGMVNAHILETETPHCASHSQKEFRIELAREMMAQHSARKRKGCNFVDSVPPSSRFCERHFPDLIGKHCNCRFCSTSVARKRTSYCCKYCNPNDPVPLCVVPCFRLYHEL